MLTKDDLLAIGNLIDEKLKPIQEQLTDQGKKLDTLELKVETVNERTERIEKKLDREVTDLAETQREILVKLDKIDDHETRIKRIETSGVLPHSH